MKTFYPVTEGKDKKKEKESVSAPGRMDRDWEYRERVVAGNRLRQGAQVRRAAARVVLPGDSELPVMLDERLLEQNIGVIGNSGSGKSVTIRKIVRQINRTLREQEKMVIFDSKGDFLEDCYQEGDLVFGVTAPDESILCSWNVFREIVIDGPDRIEENACEIARMLFADRVRRTNNPFFPESAQDLLANIMQLLLAEGECRGTFPDNRMLYETCCLTAPELLRRMQPFPGLKGVEQYIGRESAQTDGILGELRSVVRALFLGRFGQPGEWGIRDAVRNHPEIRRIFILYDAAYGKVLEPIFKTLCDLCTKESLRRGNTREIWLFMDEFRLAPDMQFIESGVSFGRKRLHLVIGLQYLGQIRNSYGQDIADGMMANLGTLIAFRTEDAETRRMVTKRFGENRKLVSYQAGAERGTQTEVIQANVVEDWDIARLRPGEAIIGHPSEEPYRFYFQE